MKQVDEDGRVECARCGQLDNVSFWVATKDGKVETICLRCKIRAIADE